VTRSIRVFAPAAILALLAAAAVFLWIGLNVGGAGDEQELLDPGALVRFMLPASRTIVDLSLAVLVGAMLMCMWALSTDKPEYGRAMDIGACGAAVLTIASGLTLILSYVDASGKPFSTGPEFGAALAQFSTEIDLGRLWIIEVLVAAVTTVLCFAIRTRLLTILPLIGAVGAIMPLAAQGHAAGASGHDLAVNAMFLHLGGAATWIGGLATLAILAWKLPRGRLPVIAERYSTIALFAYICVALSGVVGGAMRLHGPQDILGTGYGQLLLMKFVAVVLLFFFGAGQRLRLIPKLSQHGSAGTRSFVWFIVLEFVVMGAASGVAGALGRSETPVAIEPARDSVGNVPPAEWLTGDPLPPPFEFSRVFTEWKFDLMWGLFAVFSIALYIYGLWRLKQRGDRWPVGRTVCWILGMITLAYTTNGFMNAYERYVFSQHMMGHMLLTMGIPMLLVLGAPTTLAMRAARQRKDGSWGLREWIMWGVNTPWAKIITNPIVAAVIFAGSLWVFYFTPVLRWAMAEHVGHVWMIVHFLLSGYLFALVMIGIDPIPKRPQYALRLVILLATMAAHAFFGVTIMMSTGLLASDWFGAMGRTWGAPPLEDQQVGGGIAWGIGEIPTLLLTLVVAVQWSRNDDRVQKRKDRAADRLGDRELEAYNEMLAKRAERDKAYDR
jgi:cytochrome c oxidase assembly factor CtaG/putative copper export protein